MVAQHFILILTILTFSDGKSTYFVYGDRTHTDFGKWERGTFHG